MKIVFFSANDMGFQMTFRQAEKAVIENCSSLRGRVSRNLSRIHLESALVRDGDDAAEILRVGSDGQEPGARVPAHVHLEQKG